MSGLSSFFRRFCPNDFNLFFLAYEVMRFIVIAIYTYIVILIQGKMRVPLFGFLSILIKEWTQMEKKIPTADKM